MVQKTPPITGTPRVPRARSRLGGPSHDKLSGRFSEQRQRHLARQKVQEAITALHNGHTTEVTCWDHDDKKIVTETVVPPDWDFFTEGTSYRALVLFRGRVSIAMVHHDSAIRIYDTGQHIKARQVFGVVREVWSSIPAPTSSEKDLSLNRARLLGLLRDAMSERHGYKIPRTIEKILDFYRSRTKSAQRP